MINEIKKSGKILGPLASVGGVIADILTPLAPIMKWLFFVCLGLALLFFVLYIFNKKISLQNLVSSLVLVLVFGVFFLFINNTKQGCLGDNSEFISEISKIGPGEA